MIHSPPRRHLDIVGGHNEKAIFRTLLANA